MVLEVISIVNINSLMHQMKGVSIQLERLLKDLQNLNHLHSQRIKTHQ